MGTLSSPDHWVVDFLAPFFRISNTKPSLSNDWNRSIVMFDEAPEMYSLY